MYDLTDRESFENIRKWLNLVNQTVSNKTLILVGNKLDLADESRIVSEDEAEKLAKDNNILFFEGSGCSGENVEKIFKTIGDIIYSKLMDDKNENSSNSIEIKKKNEQKNKNCC